MTLAWLCNILLLALGYKHKQLGKSEWNGEKLAILEILKKYIDAYIIWNIIQQITLEGKAELKIKIELLIKIIIKIFITFYK